MADERNHSLDRKVDCTEVPEAEFQDFIDKHPHAPLAFDGMRYTYPVKLKGVVWNKPVAYKDHDGKFYKLTDR